MTPLLSFCSFKCCSQLVVDDFSVKIILTDLANWVPGQNESAVYNQTIGIQRLGLVEERFLIQRLIKNLRTIALRIRQSLTFSEPHRTFFVD